MGEEELQPKLEDGESKVEERRVKGDNSGVASASQSHKWRGREAAAILLGNHGKLSGLLTSGTS